MLEYILLLWLEESDVELGLVEGRVDGSGGSG